MKIIKEQLKTQQLNKNTYSHAKVRQELNEFETNKMKRNLEKENQIQQIHENNITQLKLLEKEMKSTCDQLEELEKQAIDSLNKTKYMNLRIIGDNPYSFKSNVNKKRSKNFKQINKSMENIKVNGIEEIKSSKNGTLRKKRFFSPTNKNQKQNLDNNNKSKTKYGNYKSINTMTKKNKSKSTQKLIPKQKVTSANNSNSNKNNKEKNNPKNDIKKEKGKKVNKKEPVKDNKNIINKK